MIWLTVGCAILALGSVRSWNKAKESQRIYEGRLLELNTQYELKFKDLEAKHALQVLDLQQHTEALMMMNSEISVEKEKLKAAALTLQKQALIPQQAPSPLNEQLMQMLRQFPELLH